MQNAMLRRRIRAFLLLLLAATALCACGPDKDAMQNGYYSATTASFNEDGWKEFITLYIYNNRIVTVEFNAHNASGLLRSWDGFAMRKAKKGPGLHPNRIIREYTQELLNRQDPGRIRKIPGDDYCYDIFVKLAAVAITQAKTGDKAVAEVHLN